MIIIVLNYNGCHTRTTSKSIISVYLKKGIFGLQKNSSAIKIISSLLFIIGIMHNTIFLVFFLN